MKRIILFILFGNMLLVACQSDQTKVNFDFETFYKNISEANSCLQEGESFGILGERVDKVIKLPIDTVTSAATLKALYYKSNAKLKTDPPPASGRCINTNIAVKERVIQRLAVMGDEAAMQTILNFYKDTSLPFAANEGKNLAIALSQFGEDILPHLEAIKDQRPRVSQMVFQTLNPQ